MDGSLLAHIAGSFVSQYENVANSSVSYLLNRYPASQAALVKLLSLTSVPSHYVTELSTKANGRPDITGLDVSGNKVVIIEGKFWAHLTDNQPTNYLKELSGEGQLLFLAPDRRLESLKAEVRKRLGEDDERIDVCSWMAFLSLIESENSKNHDGGLASDLVQLKALCEKMDEEGMPPLSMTDLDPMNGRICYQLADLIDDCNSRIRDWSESNFSGSRSTAFKDGYGFYFRAFGFGGLLTMSTSRWFMTESHAPIWFRVDTKGWDEAAHIFRDPDLHDPLHTYHEEGGVWYALALQPGMDRAQIVDSIVAQVRALLLTLLSMLPKIPIHDGTQAENDQR